MDDVDPVTDDDRYRTFFLPLSFTPKCIINGNNINVFVGMLTFIKSLSFPSLST